MCPIYDVLLQNRDSRSFVAMYALLRGEKFSQELRPMEKNDKYQVSLRMKRSKRVLGSNYESGKP